MTAGARAFLLTASRSVLEGRIAGSGEAQLWRTNNIDRYLEAFEKGAFGDRLTWKD